MAFQLNFTICQTNSCKDIVFDETTGAYNSEFNPNGYGAPNIKLGDVITSVLTITSPGGTVYTINLFTQGYPSEDLTLDGLTIPLIPNTALEDGKWTFVYTITTASNTYFKTIYKLFTCQSECCVKQMLEDLDLEGCGCDCKSTSYDNYIKAWVFLQALKNAAKCGAVSTFEKLLKIVTKLCKNKDCKTCK